MPLAMITSFWYAGLERMRLVSVASLSITATGAPVCR